MANYVWCEDQGAGFTFWNAVFGIIDSGITVISKKGISELRKAAERITDDENNYYLIIDTALDNNDVRREIGRLRKSCQSKANVSVIEFHSFEYAILSFEHLELWIYHKNSLDDEKRKLLKIKDKFVNLVNGTGNIGDLSEIKSAIGYPEKSNTEHLAARILRDITKNTMFYTDKGQLGECFINDCCNIDNRNEKDRCGLTDNYLNKDQKIKDIIEHSVIIDELTKAGLYK